MKTKELIKQLQEIDPSGELECCVGNADILFLDREPAYWDGCLQVLVKDEKGRIVGGKYTCKGSKVIIKTLSFGDAIFDVYDFPVEFEGERDWGYYKERVEFFRKQAEDIGNDVEGGFFIEYAIRRFNSIWTEDFDEDEIVKAAQVFYKENLDYRDQMPEDILKSRETRDFDGKEYNVIPNERDSGTGKL